MGVHGAGDDGGTILAHLFAHIQAGAGQRTGAGKQEKGSEQHDEEFFHRFISPFLLENRPALRAAPVYGEHYSHSSVIL